MYFYVYNAFVTETWILRVNVSRYEWSFHEGHQQPKTIFVEGYSKLKKYKMLAVTFIETNLLNFDSRRQLFNNFKFGLVKMVTYNIELVR